MKTISSELHSFTPVIALGHLLPRNSQSRLRILFFIVSSASTSTLIATVYFNFSLPILLLTGISLLFTGLWLEQCMLYCYHNTFYFRGCDSIRKSSNKVYTGLTYQAAEILVENRSDVARSFCSAPVGSEILERCGIPPTSIKAYTSSPRPLVSAKEIPLRTDEITTTFDVALHLYMYEGSFRLLVSNAGVSEMLFIRTTRFVTEAQAKKLREERWWGRDYLSRFGALGRALAEGIPYELQEFSSPLSHLSVDTETGGVSEQQLSAIEKIEIALARSRSANVFVVGNPGVGTLGIIVEAAKRVTEGRGLNTLQSLHFCILDTDLLFAKCPEAHTLEMTLHKVLFGAAQAGNYAIVIPNLSRFLTTASERGVDITALLDRYLILPSLHIIATDTPNAFHTHIETNALFVKRFEEILIEPEGVEATVSILEPLVLRTEARFDLRFTYAAIIKIAEGAERYLTIGDMPERAIQFLSEVAELRRTTGVSLITEEHVSALLSEKTGMPTGPITQSERDQLLHLEDILHTRIIGQNAAIRSLAKTMRRARVDIERADKPIGSFLFLGPTGVGKTETAKALAQVFFGSETALLRFDMSEFSTESALPHLIGNEGESGVLSDALHEHPYTVMLLDEFEKAHQTVHDLFLQILDEGFFTNNRGEKVNTRNTIIIATSNAGSDLIARTKKSRAAAPSLDTEIVGGIIKAGIFRPELINRFDNTIIFEPLSKTEQAKVAELLISDLTARVAKDGYTLKIEPTLFSFISEAGYNEQFGARAMSRVIQDTIEDTIASRIIADTIHPGDTITLGLGDL